MDRNKGFPFSQTAKLIAIEMIVYPLAVMTLGWRFVAQKVVWKIFYSLQESGRQDAAEDFLVAATHIFGYRSYELYVKKFGLGDGLYRLLFHPNGSYLELVSVERRIHDSRAWVLDDTGGSPEIMVNVNRHDRRYNYR